MRKVLPILSIALFTMPGCALFAPAPRIVQASAVGCSELLPPEWKKPVEGAPLPDGMDVGSWISFGDAQTGKLDVANLRTISAIEIIARCEARDAKAVKRASRGFFGRLFG